MQEMPDIFENIVCGADDGIILINRDHKVAFANPAVRRIFGARHDLTGMGCHDLLHGLPLPCKDTYEFKRCPHKEVFETGKPVSVTYPFILKNGEKRIFNVTASPVRHKKGDEVHQIVKVMKDVTDKARTEHMLRESETRYRNLVDNSFVGIYKSSMKGNLVYVNKALANMLGFGSPVRMINAFSKLRYRDPDSGVTLLKTLREKGMISNYRLELLTRSGASKPVLLNAFLEGDMLSGIVMDVSDQKTIEDFSKQEGLMFSSILEGMQDSMIVVNSGFEIIYANSSYMKQSRISADEIKGRHCYEVSYRRTKPCFMEGEECSVKNSFEIGAVSKTVHTYFDINNRMISVEKTAYPLRDASGNIVSVLERASDITEKVELENELRDRVRELEEFYDIAVDRELKMIELKNELEALRIKSWTGEQESRS